MAELGANTLPKEERLFGKSSIGNLLENGKWTGSGVLRCCYLPNGLEHSRLMVSVPKKSFHRAVRRNLLKRRIREAYRTRKNLLAEKSVDILFVHSPKELSSFADICRSVEEILVSLQ